MNVGNIIAQLRRERGYSQEELAGMLFVSKDLVSKWENGSRRPDYGMIERIAGVFDVSAESILEKDRYIIGELAGCFPEGESMAAIEMTDIMNGFLKTLRKEDAELFVRRYYLLETVKSLSDRKGISDSHVRSRLSKIRGKLKEYIGVKTNG